MAHFYKNFVPATRLNLCDLFGYVSCDSFTKHLVSIPGLFPKLAGQGAEKPGIRKAVRHARMAHKATKWPIKKILTGPVMRPDRTKLVK